jgi:flagellar L-ring protein precursor FlgH
MRRIVLQALLLMGCCGGLQAQSLVAAKTLADGSLFSDAVARHVGDLLTILVRETTSVRESQETETGRTSSASVSGSITPPNHSVATPFPPLSYSSDSDFKGDGSYSQSGQITATITGRVIDVLDNGNLLVEARRVLRVGEDSKTIILSGIVRTDDISPGNTVLSEKMHNFQVGIEGQGPLSRAQQRGWLGRLLDVIWPL